METTLIITLLIILAIYGVLKGIIWLKRANAEHFYNKQGQEVSKAEMEAELKWKLTPNREIPEEEAFD